VRFARQKHLGLLLAHDLSPAGRRGGRASFAVLAELLDEVGAVSPATNCAAIETTFALTGAAMSAARRRMREATFIAGSARPLVAEIIPAGADDLSDESREGRTSTNGRAALEGGILIDHSIRRA